jgi:hypothetical protein
MEQRFLAQDLENSIEVTRALDANNRPSGNKDRGYRGSVRTLYSHRADTPEAM